jgi:hypothetical protein
MFLLVCAATARGLIGLTFTVQRDGGVHVSRSCNTCPHSESKANFGSPKKYTANMLLSCCILYYRIHFFYNNLLLLDI